MSPLLPGVIRAWDTSSERQKPFSPILDTPLHTLSLYASNPLKMFHHLLLCLPVWDTGLREDTGLVADFILLGPVFLEALPVLCCVVPGPVNLLGCGDRCTLDCSFSAFSCKTRNVYLSSLPTYCNS